jgi:peroxiredoxin family protein
MYKEYLKELGIISEEDFNEVIESLPKIDIRFNEVNFNDSDKESLAFDLIDYILQDKWRGVWLYNCEYDSKLLSIDGVQTTKDLEEIKEFFSPNWIIDEYDEMLEQLKEVKEETEEMKVTVLRDKISCKLYDIKDADKLKNILDYVVKERCS